MSPAFAGSQSLYFFTHSLRCGLEECRQLCWLDKSFGAIAAVGNLHSVVRSRGRLRSIHVLYTFAVTATSALNLLRASFSACCTRCGAVPPATSWQASTASMVKC